VIFLTVGAQMPFDRLVRAVDDWAVSRSRTDVFGQIGAAGYTPRGIKHCEFLEPADFVRRVSEAQVIVAHAGMGSIITALTSGTPIVIMPRRAKLRETRNDHQFATAQRFAARDGVYVAMDERELCLALDRVEELSANAPIGAEASDRLINRIRSFIIGD